MRLSQLFCCFLYPLVACGQSQTYQNLEVIPYTDAVEAVGTTTRTLLNEEGMDTFSDQTRTIDYPTKVIRMTANIQEHKLNCAQVNQVIDEVFVNQITKDKFTYTTFISCVYDPETKLALRFTLNSYFDPISNEAVHYLDDYLKEYNGSNLLGTTLNIESAKALIISMSLSVGTKKNPNKPPFIEYREDRSNFYFKSTYDMKVQLLNDINANFYSDNADTVLPFLNKWVFNHAGELYKAILRDSDYAILQPERIFLMESGEELFVSKIKYFYAHNCMEDYEHHHCLKQEP